ncbi:secretion-regulating guanine nucleotide exchange factor [Strongylocentrotus purpuratus]|uniref:RCC1-like domain-containing protein n=1 Tax=Strongylocentrotus purpuratus TaxID=7668 RepID=A0A7M7P5G8_STRPU|nr:secretion-regulating guanine nucleotide exchange factor [Strongylocentrotus purpuratus]
MAAPITAVFSWGANSYGQLGLGHQKDHLLPENLKTFPEDVKTIVGGGGHTVFLTGNGDLHVCGSNNKGQLGLGHTSDINKLVRVPDLRPLKQIVCGWNHTVAITENDELLCWGSNTHGQLTHKESIVTKPRRIELSGVDCPRFAAISGGLRHTLAVSTDGQLWTWGAGKKGQLGWTDSKMRVPHQWNKPVHIPVKEDDVDVKFVQVAAGAYHSAALSDMGILYIWGCNKWSQLAQPKSSNPISTPKRLDPALFDGLTIKGIHSGWTHMLAITEDESVYTWGRNDYGQLGRPAAKSISNGSAESESNATPTTTTPDCCHVPTEISILKNAKQIVCGAEHSLAITKDDKLLAWGWNEHGMCADGTKTNVFLPKQVQGLDGQVASKVGVGAGHCFAFCQ